MFDYDDDDDDDSARRSDSNLFSQYRKDVSLADMLMHNSDTHSSASTFSYYNTDNDYRNLTQPFLPPTPKTNHFLTSN